MKDGDRELLRDVPLEPGRTSLPCFGTVSGRRAVYRGEGLCALGLHLEDPSPPTRQLVHLHSLLAQRPGWLCASRLSSAFISPDSGHAVLHRVSVCELRKAGFELEQSWWFRFSSQEAMGF